MFSTTLKAPANVDAITDFRVPHDTIGLDHLVFAAITTPTLAADAFCIGAVAGDADDRIIYNNRTGALLYDADGHAGGGAVQFATLATHLALTHADFVIV